MIIELSPPPKKKQPLCFVTTGDFEIGDNILIQTFIFTKQSMSKTGMKNL